ncbi:MAG: hypothetical protein MRJ65_15885 [Candidatus Brocadiaceae bacterium]|nr:hypothetical protein [Candidatus Brocadiaceae bacterium]
MKNFFLFGILFLVFTPCSQAYAQKQESEETFEYQKWQFLYESKCSKCHTLERIFADTKTEDEWRICVNRMMEKSPLWITPEEGEQVIIEILQTKKEVVGTFPRKKKYDDARLLFIDRCTNCHPVNRIFKANKTREEWEETVLRMRDNAPELFSEEDIPILIDFLSERGEIMRDDVAAGIMVEKCLICHEGGRILLERKSKRDWEKTVKDMRVITREKLKKDWFTHEESKVIVDLLVRTQGIEAGGG